MSRPKKAVNSSPLPIKVAGSTLPRRHTPTLAAWSSGPFLDPKLVTPSEWTWRGARTYVVDTVDGEQYRALRVESEGEFIGYWAVELLGTPLTPDKD